MRLWLDTPRRVSPLFFILLFSSCSDGFPPGFHKACTDDEQCRSPYQCLVWDDRLNGETQVCSLTCATDEDCPSLYNDHCGEGRLCDGGVCAYSYCY